MSIKDGKVLLYISRHRNRLVVGALVCVQVVLSVILSISLAGHLIWPENSSAAAGVPMQIAYEGRLTDSSGNALGGTGTVYCYRFSIYDAASGGNKLWPAGTPAQTTATTTDGVFAAVIGEADTLSSSVFDFSTTSAAYLQVEVNTTTSTCGGSWEALSPRQSVLSSGYALQSANVYGSLLKTDTVNNRVQIGTGAGTPSPVYLGLDFRNSADYVGQSCSTNGLMWYNSANSQALICEGGLIQNLGSVGTTTIAAINANTGTPASAGTVVFSNSNGVSFGINGNTITASVNAGGGYTVSSFEPYPALSASALLSSNGNTSGPASFIPFNVGQYVDADYLNLAASVSFVTLGTSAGSQSYTLNYGLYSRGTGASTSLISQITSNSFSLRMSWSNSTFTVSQPTSTNSAGFTYGTTSSAGSNLTSAYTGFKMLQLPINSTISPGVYWLGFFDRISTSSISGGIKLSIAGLAQGTSLANMAPIGSFSTAYSTGTNATAAFGGNWYLGAGSYSSAAQTNLPASVAFSAMTNNINVRPYIRLYATN